MPRKKTTEVIQLEVSWDLFGMTCVIQTPSFYQSCSNASASVDEQKQFASLLQHMH